MSEVCKMLGFLTGLRITGQRSRKVETWETLFESEVTTEAGNQNGAYCELKVGDAYFTALETGETYRLTVDGASTVDLAYEGSTTHDILFGNEWLLDGEDAEIEDSGADYALWRYVLQALSVDYTRFFSRTPGTYAVKIERLVT